MIPVRERKTSTCRSNTAEGGCATFMRSGGQAVEWPVPGMREQVDGGWISLYFAAVSGPFSIGLPDCFQALNPPWKSNRFEKPMADIMRTARSLRTPEAQWTRYVLE